MSNFRVLTLQSLRVTTTIGSRRLLPESKNRGYGDDAFTILFVIIIVAMLISFAYLIYRMVNRENPVTQQQGHNLLQERKDDNHLQISSKQPQVSDNGRDNGAKTQLDSQPKNKTLIGDAQIEIIQVPIAKFKALDEPYVAGHISVEGQVLHDEEDEYGHKKSQEEEEVVEKQPNGSEYSEHNLSNVFNLENEESQPRKRKVHANGKKYEIV